MHTNGTPRRGACGPPGRDRATVATTAGIAEALVLSEETVASHVKNIRRKLGVRSRADAVRAATAIAGVLPFR